MLRQKDFWSTAIFLCSLFYSDVTLVFFLAITPHTRETVQCAPPLPNTPHGEEYCRSSRSCPCIPVFSPRLAPPPMTQHERHSTELKRASSIRSTLSRHLKKVESLNFEFPSLSLPLDSSRYAISRRSHQRTPSNESFSSAQTTSGFDHSGSNSAGSSYASHDATPLDVAGLEQDRTGEERAQMAGMANASSAVEIAECPACSESLLMRFGGEKTVTPRCGHRLRKLPSPSLRFASFPQLSAFPLFSDQECFIAVYGSITRGKTLGVCGICRDNIIISDDGPSGGRNSAFFLFAYRNDC